MRKFKFFALAFAAIAFAGCSDDAIDGQGGNTGTIGDGTPAYLTISFTANDGSSSRAEGVGTNTGDKDGDAEDSGHSTPGTTEETAVNSALVVVYTSESNKACFAKLYGKKDLNQTTPGTGDGFVITDTKSQSYVSAKPIQVETGNYNVLVVINPVNTLTAMLGESAVESTENATVKKLYDAILNNQYAFTAPEGTTDNYTNAANSIGNGTDGFMMTNKKAESVPITEDNTEAKPAVANVVVERTLSKITYRTKKTNNIYPVEVKTSNTKARTVDGAVSFDDGGTYQKVTLNVAVDSDEPEPNVVYAYYEPAADEGEEPIFKGVYKQREGQKQSVKDGESTITLTVYEKVTATTEDVYDNGTTDKDDYYVAVDFDGDKNISLEEEERSLVLQADESSTSTTPNKWYVQLKGYALINLSKSVNYVRHTTTDSDDENVTVFGTLTDGKTYLWTPNWAAKNDMSTEYADVENADDWFYNTLAQVSGESKTLDATKIADATYYRALPTGDGEVVSGKDDQHDEDYIAANKTGGLMSYCFENSTDQAHQYHGVSTAISFMAQIYTDENCQTPLNTPLYRYAGHVYTSLEAIQNAYGAGTPSAIRDLVAKEKGSEEIANQELEAANVVRYNGNTCYYYTTEIKHFDNGDPTASGVMEYAIMRNNIYSLSVTNITDIGDPFVDPTPNVPNESDKAYMSVNVTMEPWIVRYNDIEF